VRHSGMKAALNGALNCSILDGWWNECYDGRNGWAIGTAHEGGHPEEQDRVDASALYNLLEREIAPRFYDRSEGPVPRRWVERMKYSIASLGGFVTADRMLRDYVTNLYEPAAAQGANLERDGHARARSLAAWKARVKESWPGVAVVDVEGDVTAARVGAERPIVARVRLGELVTDDVCVQLAHGLVGANGSLIEPQILEMQLVGSDHDVFTYRGVFTTAAAGLYGFAVRALPKHVDLTSAHDLGLIAWA
jgi:starch phosphorylase